VWESQCSSHESEQASHMNRNQEERRPDGGAARTRR
jgi:hypothetical protein